MVKFYEILFGYGTRTLVRNFFHAVFLARSTAACYAPYPINTCGCRVTSGSALRISSWTIQGTLPSPKSRKLKLAARGLFVPNSILDG